MIIRSYSDSKYIYSVNMMFIFINMYKYKHRKILLNNIINNLHYNVWGSIKSEDRYSPMNVINNPNNYEKNSKLIKESELKYPIIGYFVIDKNNKNNIYIIDGYHRLAKAYLDKNKYINIYIFTQEMLKYFKITKYDYNGIDLIKNIKESEILSIYNKRFTQK